MDFMLYKLNILQTINVASMLNPPPTIHEMNIGKNLKHMFATKCPRRLAGKTIAKYFNVVLIKSNLKSGTAFFINLKLSNDIIVIDKQNARTIEFMPINQVVPSKIANNTEEPIK